MLEIKNLIKSYTSDKKARKAGEDQSVFAVDDVSFTVEKGELFTLLGPSGCGKTTTLRSIAGLESPDSGQISVNGRTLFSAGIDKKVTNVPANERGLGMVFQSYAIWPHMTVFDNVAFPLQVRPRSSRPGKAEIEQRVHRVLEVMELRKYSDRQATKLSGGQQQRLALARAIVIEPELLLLDEPLSNLDAKLRESLRFELKRLQSELGITSIYVTHDQIEALSMSSTIAVMSAGKVQQLGKPREIYENPVDRFVAEFIGTSNFIPGRVKEKVEESYLVETSDGALRLRSTADVPSGSDVVVSIRPEAIEIHREQPNLDNVWRGTISARGFLGDAMDHVVATGQVELRARSLPNISVEPGTEVYLHIPEEKISLVPVS